MNGLGPLYIYDNNFDNFDNFMSKFEIERALLDVKITAEKRCLGEEEIKCEKIKVQVIELEENFFMKREKVK